MLGQIHLPGEKSKGRKDGDHLPKIHLDTWRKSSENRIDLDGVLIVRKDFESSRAFRSVRLFVFLRKPVKALAGRVPISNWTRSGLRFIIGGTGLSITRQPQFFV